MRAEIISVGTELLLGQIVDTNAAYLSKRLPEYGVDLLYRATVGDNESRLAEAVSAAMSRADLVFTIGGLGPTQDDLTKETVAAVAADPMRLDKETADRLRAFFAAREIEMPETNLKQAMVPTRGTALDNPLGTAPGAVFETESGKAIICLPGPPREFVPMVDERVVPYLSKRLGQNSEIITSRELRLAGIGESTVEDKVKELLCGNNPTVAPLAHTGEVHLRITAKASSLEEARQMIDVVDAKLVSILEDRVFGRDDQTLESVVVESLLQRNLTLAVAESCTGGLITSRITDIPGSSGALLFGVAAYSNKAKKELLGVPGKILEESGAVSEQCARAMAENVRALAGSDYGLSVTGIAGPGGGSPEKPVGLVYIGLASGSGTYVRKHNLSGNRADVKYRSSQNALDMLRTFILFGKIP